MWHFHLILNKEKFCVDFMIKKFLNFYPCVFEVEGGICDMINKTMYQNRATRVVWKQILPMLQGKILYYPDTPAVRKIIKEVNTKVSQYK